jgi:probable rRNA maturation factor
MRRIVCAPMPVIVRIEGRVTPRARRAVALTTVRRWAGRMLEAMRLEQAELGVMLCDDRTIHALNHAWRGKDSPTDVLAFAMNEGKGAELARARQILGDVVISLDTAARQASERDRSTADEVLTLLAHGLLHLCGYDHRDRAEERRMNARTDALRAAATVQDRGRTSTVDKVRGRLPWPRWRLESPPPRGARKRRHRG